MAYRHTLECLIISRKPMYQVARCLQSLLSRPHSSENVEIKTTCPLEYKMDTENERKFYNFGDYEIGRRAKSFYYLLYGQ